jgi:hypothetical protein
MSRARGAARPPPPGAQGAAASVDYRDVLRTKAGQDQLRELLAAVAAALPESKREALMQQVAAPLA